jgi:membrane associated rhomboid family serine protease
MSPMPTCYRHPDRETGLSCSECGRPICTECMTVAPVGIRCPDHAGKQRTVRAPRIVARPAGNAIVTKVLIALNVGIYLVTAVQGNGLNQPAGRLFTDWALFGPYVAQGDWWRLVTSMFLHGFVLHIVFNMVALWYIGRPVEEYLGSLRYALLYLVSGLAGSAGALVADPTGVTVGASGAIFGILGAMLILEWNATGRFGGAAASLIAINLVFNFAYNGAGGNISIGGHIGGLIGGILVTLAFARWGRGHAAYGKLGVPGIVGLVAVAAASILIAYLKVRNLA